MSGGSRFDRTADRYAAHAAGREWGGFVAWCECRPTDRVLDVAGGPGALAGVLPGSVAAVTVLDASPRLLGTSRPGWSGSSAGPSSCRSARACSTWSRA